MSIFHRRFMAPASGKVIPLEICFCAARIMFAYEKIQYYCTTNFCLAVV